MYSLHKSHSRSELPLKLHEWHTVRVSRTARLAFLSVDSQQTQTQLSEGAFDELTADQVCTRDQGLGKLLLT